VRSHEENQSDTSMRATFIATPIQTDSNDNQTSFFAKNIYLVSAAIVTIILIATILFCLPHNKEEDSQTIDSLSSSSKPAKDLWAPNV